MKAIFEYNAATGEIKDRSGNVVYMMNMTPFEEEVNKSPVLELIKQGVTPDEIIKLKNNDLL